MQTQCTAGPHGQYLIVTKLFGFESIVVFKNSCKIIVFLV